jgi:GNAT superfamily N-acetyltransferase
LIKVFPQGAWGAFGGEKLIGYIYFHPYFHQTAKPLNSALNLTGGEDCMYLHEIAVLPEYRLHDIPSRLMKELDEVSALYKMKYQSLVSVQNSVGFWEKKGFSTIREIDECGYVNSFLMSKHLF